MTGGLSCVLSVGVRDIFLGWCGVWVRVWGLNRPPKGTQSRATIFLGLTSSLSLLGLAVAKMRLAHRSISEGGFKMSPTACGKMRPTQRKKALNGPLSMKFGTDRYTLTDQI